MVFVAFEGGEASGKSTQAARLAARLGPGTVLTREPGGTALGARMRALLLDPATDGLDDRAEALLMAADRAQHVAEVIGPALAAGHDVVTDRFTGSSLAYQGYGRGLDVDAVRALSTFATGGIEPSVVVLLTVPRGERAARLAERGAGADRMEAEAPQLHDRVDAGYLELAAADPGRWVVVAGDGDVDVVAARVWEAVASRLA